MNADKNCTATFNPDCRIDKNYIKGAIKFGKKGIRLNWLLMSALSSVAHYPGCNGKTQWVRPNKHPRVARKGNRQSSSGRRQCQTQD